MNFLRNIRIFVMKVHLIRKGTIEEFVVHHAASRPAFKDWLARLKHADWDEPEDKMDRHTRSIYEALQKRSAIHR